MEYYFEEALLAARRKGIVNARKLIREEYWPNSNPSSQRSNLANMIEERTTPTVPFLVLFAKICKCSTDFICYGKEI